MFYCLGKEINRLLCLFFLSPRDIQERYRTLSMYGIKVAEEELEVAASIEGQWRALFSEARQLDKSLIAVKKKFTLVGRWDDKLEQALSL